MTNRLVALTLLLVGISHNCAAITWYTVELIAFQHLSSDGLYAESWPESPGGPATHNALKLTLSGELSVDAETEGLYAFKLLDVSQLQLADISSSLRRSEGYRPLLHIAWRQPGFSRSNSRAVYIHSALPNRYQNNETAFGGFGGAPELLGTLRLSRARYLHVDADLLHFRRGSSYPYRLQQSRRMRSTELHYIDHPSFGLLVRVTPFEPVEVFTDEQAETSE